MNDSKIIIANKPVSLTSKDFADKIKENYKFKKICFCGRLDPMARGEMLLLADEMCKFMDENQKYDKTYQFEIVFGIKTDSDDPLGIFEEISFNFNKTIILEKIINEIKNYPKTFTQDFHKFSSIRVNGKPLWLHSKNNNNIKKPNHSVTIKSTNILNENLYTIQSFSQNIIRNIDQIYKKHDLRQELISKNWNKFMIDNEKKNIYSLKVELTVSTGFYIRQFVRDISNKINFPLMVYDINRIKINLNN